MGIVCPFFVPKNIDDMHISKPLKTRKVLERRIGRTAGVPTAWRLLLQNNLGGEILRCTF